MMRLAAGLAFAALLVGCGPAVLDPIVMDSPAGVLDLRAWNFASGGPVVPQNWLWDNGVLWNPESGRPADLPEPVVGGPPSKGGPLVETLRQHATASATLHLVVLVTERQNYTLQIGAVPGVVRVWVNGTALWSSDSGGGTVLSVQPVDAKLDLVATVQTSDFLVHHRELNRDWIVGPGQALLVAGQAERTTRSFQAMFLALAAILFLGMAMLRRDQRSLFPFVGFLLVCLAKMLANVEQSEPLLAPFWPGISPSLYLWLNHGLNLLPFPFLVLFLVRQYPQSVSLTSALVVAGVTALVTAWELLPFALLSLGQPSWYEAVMATPWAFVLNLYVVVVVLFIFERIYHVWAKRLPLSGALFLGGIGIGLLILLPIPLSYFLPVKYTYFLGWGLFLFLFVLGFELIRLQVLTTEAEFSQLHGRLEQQESLARFLPSAWGARLGKDTAEALRPGDRRATEAILIQVRSPDSPELWLRAAGEVADQRRALLVEWHDGTGIWALDSWPEAALALGLEIRRALDALQGLRFRIVVAKAAVEFRVLEAGQTWLASVSGMPRARLAELDALAETFGGVLVLDAAVKDGLVIGGWRRHRHLTPSGEEIELYEGEEDALATIKDQTIDQYESALTAAREGRPEQALAEMVAVVRKNPFDQAARAHLAAWGT